MPRSCLSVLDKKFKHAATVGEAGSFPNKKRSRKDREANSFPYSDRSQSFGELRSLAETIFWIAKFAIAGRFRQHARRVRYPEESRSRDAAGARKKFVASSRFSFIVSVLRIRCVRGHALSGFFCRPGH